MPYKLVGRTTLQKGRRLWELVGRLKNFGVGRLVVRSAHDHYPEPCFYRIVMAKPEMDTGRPHMDEDNLKGSVLVERIFRGRHDGVVDISKVAYKPDFRLVHRHEEARYIEAYKNYKPEEVRLINPVLEMPPLLKLVAERDGHAAKELKVRLCRTAKNCRLAKEGETPTETFSIGLGKPANPDLYEGIL
ncbi:28S ribosomal protein S34, mitochondrial-like [Eriocheir sinensis]|uniref:28S ribosomal protein S34, mitochondrial-like n=1 Tax=Eriocheir sinensis TaxID=95602 RepID=UPI0021C873E7|nr:28S ribosomal protein S34, mitochondrial-like [Eriocheir sinensis]